MSIYGRFGELDLDPDTGELDYTSVGTPYENVGRGHHERVPDDDLAYARLMEGEQRIAPNMAGGCFHSTDSRTTLYDGRDYIIEDYELPDQRQRNADLYPGNYVDARTSRQPMLKDIPGEWPTDLRWYRVHGRRGGRGLQQDRFPRPVGGDSRSGLVDMEAGGMNPGRPGLSRQRSASVPNFFAREFDYPEADEFMRDYRAMERNGEFEAIGRDDVGGMACSAWTRSPRNMAGPSRQRSASVGFDAGFPEDDEFSHEWGRRGREESLSREWEAERQEAMEGQLGVGPRPSGQFGGPAMRGGGMPYAPEHMGDPFFGAEPPEFDEF